MKIGTGYTILFCLLLSTLLLQSQSKSIEKDIESVTTHFQIADDLSYSAERLFDSIFRVNQFVILGEYHGSSRIGELTSKLIAIYSKNGGKYFGLEISPTVSRYLNQRLADTDAVKLLGEINSKYYLPSDDRNFTPIPFFSNVEDAAFLQTAKEHDLELVGVDQEYIYSYQFLLDEVLETFGDERADSNKLSQLVDSIKIYQQYDMDFRNGDRSAEYRLPLMIHKSKFITEELAKLSVSNSEVGTIAKSIIVSNEIYYNNVVGDWWSSNELRTRNFVNNFRSLYVSNGRILQDKLFLKVGGLHAAKGINDYNKYDVGNLVYETSRLNRTSSCHIIILDRYWDENGDTTDILSDTTSWYGNNFKQLLSAGVPDKWTTIDLRRIRKQGLYRKEVNERVREYFERYDLVLIPPTDNKPRINLN